MDVGRFALWWEMKVREVEMRSRTRGGAERCAVRTEEGDEDN